MSGKAYLRAFGHHVEGRVVPNDEIAPSAEKSAAWIEEVSGIRERRWTSAETSVAALAAGAATDCLARSGSITAADIGMVIVSSGSADRRFPGPAAEAAKLLGCPSGVPALDLPLASAGSLFGITLAARLVDTYQNILVIGSEKMSAIVDRDPLDPNTGILFGDGAGAVLVSSQPGGLRIAASAIHSDGAFTADLRLDHSGQLTMNGMQVIVQASRKIPAAIAEVLAQAQIEAAAIDRFCMHQANQNLIVRVAKAVGVAPEKFYSNIARYGNTSSASMLIAASECITPETKSVCFAAFGAGFHWGALVALADS